MDSGHIALTERDLPVRVHEKKEDSHYLEFAWEAEKKCFRKWELEITNST